MFLLALAVAVSGCGGGGDTTSAPAEASAPSTLPRRGTSEKKTPREGKRAEGARRPKPGSSAHHVNAAPLKVSGGGSAQFEVKGGDNSVQEYGAESGESELREVAERVHSFFVARVGEEWAHACAYLAKATIEGFEELAASSPRLKGKGCAGVLDALTKPVPGALQRDLTTFDAHALRTDGEQAFLIYTGSPGKTVYSMPLRLEDGEWKVGALSGAALPGAREPR